MKIDKNAQPFGTLVALVTLGAVVLYAAGTAAAATAPPPSRPVSAGQLIKIAIVPDKTDNAKTTKLGGMADVINKNFPLYSAWVVGSGYCPLPAGQQCSPVDASILIRAGAPTGDLHYHLTSIDIVDGGVLANV